MVGYWATLSLNIPDFTRYARSQGSQIVGQAFGLPVAMILYTFIGIACTSASIVVFGRAIWNPITLLGLFHQPLVAFLALVSILHCDTQRQHRCQRGQPLQRLLQPRSPPHQLPHRRHDHRLAWPCHHALEADGQPQQLHLNWLVGYSGLLGPVAGIMIADYFLVRGTRLDTESLYRREGPYEYRKGFNPRALVALAAGVFAALIGLACPTCAFSTTMPGSLASPWPRSSTSY